LPPPGPPPGPFDAECTLLDRLSLWYGGQYRGVILFNVEVALLGGVAALAAIHATLSTAELGRLASTSQQMSEWIDELRAVVEARHAEGAGPAELRTEVETFCRLVTEEASGWKALLRDKDVPLH
jgi:hypothetical protein